MGRDKSLLPFGGFSTLAQYQFRRLSLLFSNCYISAKNSEKFDFEVPVIPDPKDAAVYAPTAGFVGAFEALDSERIFVLSVDTPFVDEAEIAALLKADETTLDAVIARTASGSHPMCGIYHRSLFEPFKQMLAEENHRLGQLLKTHNTRYVDFSDETPFANLNHPHEYRTALDRHASSGK